MSQTVSAEVPINIRWTQELVDDGKNGENFYIRLTPKISRSGRYMKGLSTIKVNKLMSIKVRNLETAIQRLKQEKTEEIKRAAKQGAQQGIKSDVFDAQRRKKELAEYTQQAKIAEEARQQNEMFGPQISSSRFQELMWAEAEKRGDTLKVAKEEPEEEVKEKEEIYYIK